MPLNLRLCILLIAFILTVVIYKILKKQMVPVKYSLLWILCVLLLYVLSICPNILLFIADLVGFQTISNMVIGVFVLILIFITISLTIIASFQKKKTTLLIQEISILKSRVSALENEVRNND